MVWVMRKLANLYGEMDLGLAVMRGEEPVAGHTPGVDRSRKIGRDCRGSALGCRCCRGCCVR